MDIETYINMNCDPDEDNNNNNNRLNKTINNTKSILSNHNINQSELNRKLKPRGNYLLRQELNDYTPECSIKFIIIYHIAFGLLCFSFAIPIMLPHTDSYYEMQYDKCNIKEFKDDNDQLVRYCNVSFTITKDLSPPIYLYYKLDNYFSNHREYVKSKLYNQLRGEEVKDSAYVANCDTVKYNKDLFGLDSHRLVSFTDKQTPLDPDAYLNPCGLIAASYFNDSFTLMKSSKGNSNAHNNEENKIHINESGIAYASDRKYMYKRNSDMELQWIDVENEHFMVWMNMELFPHFIKKWGHIDSIMPKGEYMMRVDWHWDSKTYGTEKYFVISEGLVLGTEPLFGYVLLTGALLSIIMIAIMGVKGCPKVKPFNPNLMSWD